MMKTSISLAVLCLLGEASALRQLESQGLDNSTENLEFLDSNIEDVELEDTMLLQIDEQVNKPRGIIRGKFAQMNRPRQFVQLVNGKTKEVESMIVELENSQEGNMAIDNEGKPPVKAMAQKKTHHNKHHKKHHHHHHNKEMVQRRSSGLPENAGNLPNVQDDHEQRQTISQGQGYGAAAINKQHDNAMNTAGSGKQIFAQKKYDLPENAGNLPNVQDNHEQRQTISQGQGYGAASINKQHDNAMNTAGSGKQIFAQKKYDLPVNSGNLPNVQDDHEQRQTASQGQGYGAAAINKQHDNAMNTAGSGKQIFAQKKYDLPENAGNLPNVQDNHEQRQTISQGQGYGAAAINKQHDNAMNTAGSGKQIFADKGEVKQQEEDPLKSVLSELENDDSLIDSFIDESKGKSVEQVATKIEDAPSFLSEDH